MHRTAQTAGQVGGPVECPGRRLTGRQCWVCPGCPRDPGTQRVPDTISTHRRGGDQLLTAVVLSPQVVGLRTSHTQAHPPAWRHHRDHNFYICPTNKRKAGAPCRRLSGRVGGVTLLLWSPEGRRVNLSALCGPLSLFHLSSFGQRGV